MIVAHIGEVRVLVRLERETILGLPFVTLSPLYNHIAVGVHQTISRFALHLLAAIVQQQWFPERISEPDVCEPSIFELYPQRHMIERRVEAAFIASHSSRKHRHFK